MHWKSVVLAALPVLLPLTAFAQAGKEPQPAPEVKKLDYFAGTWKTVGQMKPSQFGPGGSFTSTEHYEWQKGNFFLIGHSEFKTPGGDGIELSVLGYDPTKNVYSYHSFNSAGEQESATGTIAGDTWTWTGGEQSPFKWRYIEKVLSPASYAVKFEGSPDGTNYSTLLEATVTKQ